VTKYKKGQRATYQGEEVIVEIVEPTEGHPDWIVSRYANTGGRIACFATSLRPSAEMKSKPEGG
jgi:hypothetical protein